MDPYIEGQSWRDFHHRIITGVSDALTPEVLPRYVVRIDERVYVDMLPRPERVREAYLTVRRRETLEVVTVIEVLSPGNKRSGSDGQHEYMQKREEVVGSTAHLVELDLLRGGERLPTVESLPAGDYYGFVARAEQRPKVNVYAWSLRQPLPTIPIPLSGSDPEVALDLQAVFNTVYDRAAYAFSLDYMLPVQPPLDEEDAIWVQEMLSAR